MPRDAVLPREHGINHVANDDPECAEPVELAEGQNGLFL